MSVVFRGGYRNLDLGVIIDREVITDGAAWATFGQIGPG